MSNTRSLSGAHAATGPIGRMLGALRWIAVSLAVLAAGAVYGVPDALAASAPTVGSVVPNAGPTAGGTAVTITGANLSGTTAVAFGGGAGTGVTNVSSTEVTATSPAGNAGTADVQVTTAGGTSVPDPQDVFTYEAVPQVLGVSPSSGSTNGGATVTIYGQGFVSGATSVAFGATPATSVTFVSSSELTAVSPAGTAGAPVDVEVTTAGGTSAANPADQYTYGPGTPYGLTLNETGLTEAAITWSAPAIPGVIGYTVLRNGVALPPPAGQFNSGASNSPQTTLDGLAANYLDTGLAPNTSYTYTVEALTSAGLTAASPPLTVTTASPSASTTHVLTQCSSTPLGGGTYVLSADLTATANNNCLTFVGQSGTPTNVTLDCQDPTTGQDHSIINTSTVYAPLVMSGVSHFLVTNCNFQGQAVGTGWVFDNASNGTVEGNQFTSAGVGGVQFEGGGPGLVFDNNVLTNATFYEAEGISHSYVGANTITLPDGSVTGTLIGVVDGADNVVDANKVNGDALSGGQRTQGSDDGVVVQQTTAPGPVTGDIVADNTVADVWDAGIETAGFIANTTIEGNTISDAWNGGVTTYGEHMESWLHNSVLDNAVSQSNSLFYLNFATNAPPPGQSDIYSEYNTLVGNTFTSPINTSGGYQTGLTVTWNATNVPVLLGGGNTLSDDNNGAQSILVDPPSLVRTSAGNTCGPAGADEDLLTCAAGPAPLVSGVSPASGPIPGPTPITITGSGFTGATAVSWGNDLTGWGSVDNCAALNAYPNCFTVVSDSTITLPGITAPGTSAITGDFVVTGPGGSSPLVPADQFTFEGAPTVTSVGPVSGGGGTRVEIAGTNLAGAKSVTFGGVAASIVSDSQGTLTATAPPGTVGTVNVVVTTGVGTSPTSSADQFTYTSPPLPAVTSLSPTTGPAETLVIIHGQGFTGIRKVYFGSTPATVIEPDGTSIELALSPAHAAGTVDVTVVSNAGTSAITSADHYKYP